MAGRRPAGLHCSLLQGKEGSSTVIIIAAIAIPFPFFLRAINSSDPPRSEGSAGGGGGKKRAMPCLTNGVELLSHAMSPFPLPMPVASTLKQNSAPSILETPSKLKTGLFSSTPVLIGSNGVNGDTAWHCRCSLARCTMDGFRSEIAQWQSPQKMQSTPGGKRRQKNAEESRPRSTRRARGLRRRRGRESA